MNDNKYVKLDAEKRNEESKKLPLGEGENRIRIRVEEDCMNNAKATTKQERYNMRNYLTEPQLQLQQKLSEAYELRYNVLTEQTEYRKKYSSDRFSLLDKRHMNTMCLELMEQGIRCWDKDVQRFIGSSRIDNYHPFAHYMNHLPLWDGKDRVEPLIRRITSDPICIRAMYHWLIAMTAQWMNTETQTSNSLVPLLISEEQGLGKSTFCRHLLPPVLRGYYTDMVELNAKGRIGQRLVQNGLINLDEFDRIPAHRMPYLKNIIQVKDVSLNRAYTGYFSNLPRIASFIGTSNRMDLLTDPTGSRRFICILIEAMIDNSPIEYDQLYAELKWLVDAGERTYLTHQEEEELQRHNRPFQRCSPSLNLFNEQFKACEHDHGKWMTINDIVAQLTKKRSVAHLINPFVLAKELTLIGIRKEHRRDGNYYYVEKRPPELP